MATGCGFRGGAFGRKGGPGLRTATRSASGGRKGRTTEGSPIPGAPTLDSVVEVERRLSEKALYSTRSFKVAINPKQRIVLDSHVCTTQVFSGTGSLPLTCLGYHFEACVGVVTRTSEPIPPKSPQKESDELRAATPLMTQSRRRLSQDSQDQDSL